MEKLLPIKQEYASLEKIEAFINKESSFEAKQEYDSWDLRKDANGQMEKCVIIKKSNMHGAKLFFTDNNTMKINFFIPNKMMNAFFGENKQKYKGIREIVAGKIRAMALSGSQKKAFNEILQAFDKIKA